MTPRRPVLAGFLLLHAAVLAAAGIYLPWRAYTVFAIVTLALALLHVLAAVAAALVPRYHRGPLRLVALASLAYQGYLAYVVAASALQLVAIHGSLGAGLAVALAACWVLLGMFTVPVALYGLAATGGIRAGRAAGASAAAGLLLVAAGSALRASEVRALPLPQPDVAPAAIRGRTSPASLRSDAPADCARPPSPAAATVLVTWVPQVAARAESRCLQGPPADVSRSLVELVRHAARPVKIDVIVSVRDLGGVFPHDAPFALRGGEDGICAGPRCLAPWQLVAGNLLEGFALPGVDARIGADPEALRHALGAPGEGLAGLSSIRTRSLLVRADGTLADLSPRGGDLDEAQLRRAVAAAEAFVLSAQEDSGRFLYLMDAITGDVSFRGFAVPRQAGTTMAVCELGTDADRVLEVALQSLNMLAGLEKRGGERGAILQPRARGPVVRIGSTALSLVAFLTCRDIVGPVHDALIGRLGRTLLALQRPDGNFAPAVNVESFGPVEIGHQPLYADGQVVLALVLLEQLAARSASPELPPAAVLGDAAARAMRYFGEDYRTDPAADFFHVEENWHCLAARAALTSRRVDSYERFCLDYAWSKARFVLEGGAPAYEGGNGFGNVTVPLTTNTAGFGEALAASIDVARARGEDVTGREHEMRLTLAFLARAQLDEDRCFACARGRHVVGGFGASPVSPKIRIDYVQHAWAALGHGGRALGLLPPAAQPGDDPLHAEERGEGDP